MGSYTILLEEPVLLLLVDWIRKDGVIELEKMVWEFVQYVPFWIFCAWMFSHWRPTIPQLHCFVMEPVLYNVNLKKVNLEGKKNYGRIYVWKNLTLLAWEFWQTAEI